MAGEQFGFSYDSDFDLNILYETLNLRLDTYLSDYSLRYNEIVYVLISFRTLDKKLYSNFTIDKSFVTKHNIKPNLISKIRKTISIPGSVNEGLLGKPLVVVSDPNNKLTKVETYINGVLCNFLDKIAFSNSLIRSNLKSIRNVFSTNSKFYSIKTANGHFIFVITVLPDKKIEKLVYSLSGALISSFVDLVVGNKVYRSSRNETLELVNNKLLTKSQKISLKAIEKPKLKLTSWLPNPNIGVLDLETYKDLVKDTINVYAVGIKTNLSPEPLMFYIDKELNSHILVLKIIDEMLRSKYSNITFYAHNLGGYDIVFILKILYDYNDSVKSKDLEYKVIPIVRDNKIIKVTIQKGIYSVVIMDSYCILTSSLYELCESFNVKTKKSVFPHSFAIKNNLFYKGVIPSKDYYKNISNDEYNKLKDNLYSIWSFQDECLKYLNNDLMSLFEVLNKANNQVFEDYKINRFKFLFLSFINACDAFMYL